MMKRLFILVLMACLTLAHPASEVQAQTTDEFVMSYAKNAVTQIAKKADLVYSQRMDAKVKIEVYVPPGVEYVNITGNDINMRIISRSGPVDVFATSIAQLQGSIPADEGLYSVLIKAEGNYVNITLA